MTTPTVRPEFSVSDIRKTFLDFFASKGHTVVPSSSLVPGLAKSGITGPAAAHFIGNGMTLWGTGRAARGRADAGDRSD